jgi:nucleotide-binding universal stress UspA family protein
MNMTKTALKILLPVDIAHTHPEMFGVLKEYLPLKDAQVTLLYVREEMPAYESMIGTMADFPTDLPNQIESRAKTVLAELAEILKPDCKEVKTLILMGPSAMMIESVAEDNGIDLIAMAPGVHTKVAQYLIGSTCERVAKHSRISVLIVRQPDVKSLRNVVVGIDGSQSALDAMLNACEIFSLKERGAKITLVNVVSVTGIVKYISPPAFVARVEDNLMMSGEACLAEAEKVLNDTGMKEITVKLKNGDPETELIAVANELNAELVVVGGQGRSALEHLFVGSVSGKVVSHATCTTVVFKSPKAPRALKSP